MSIPSHRIRLLPFFEGLIRKHQGDFTSILDLGCGELGAAWKQRLSDKYTGYDNRESVNPDYVGDACDLSCFSDDSFDVVVGWSSIEHVTCPYHMIIEMRRVSKGTCIVTTDFTHHDKDGDNSHLYSWTPKTFKQLISTVHSNNKVYVDGGMMIGVLYNCDFTDGEH